jgi:hypothetical protein
MKKKSFKVLQDKQRMREYGMQMVVDGFGLCGLFSISDGYKGIAPPYICLS